MARSGSTSPATSGSEHRDGHTAGEAALPETWFRELPNGKTVGFVGAVTEDLPALVAGDGISEIEVTDIVESVNTHADELKAPGGCEDPEGCDLVVMLVHEGAATTSYSAVTDDSTFAHIVSGADEDIDAIVSGHTHLAYNHKVPVQEWIDEGRAVTNRPVVSAGQYGASLNSLEFEYLPGTDELVNIRQTVLALKDYDADPATQAIVDEAVNASAEVGNRALGDIEGPFQRARRNDPVAQSVVENRGGESTLGNLVAEIQRWKTDADIAFMNPGGLRADMLGDARHPARPDLPPGGRRPAVRQHPGDDGPHGCPDQDGPRAAVAARRRQQHPVAPVPPARHLPGLHLDVRRIPRGG